MFLERPASGFYSETSRFSWSRLVSSIADHRQRYLFAAETFRGHGFSIIGDMGCGIGESTEFLVSELTRRNINPKLILGIDISSESIERAKQKLIPGAVFLHGNLGLANLLGTLKDKNFWIHSLSGITFIETMEHIKPVEAVHEALVNLRELLEPSFGRVIISVPNRALGSNIRLRPYNPFHAQEYSIDEFAQEIGEAGFDITHIYGQRIVEKDFVKVLRPLQVVANTTPKLRALGKLIAGLILLKQPDARILPFDSDNQTAKYFIAVCKTK